jgi:hypothetical protein
MLGATRPHWLPEQKSSLILSCLASAATRSAQALNRRDASAAIWAFSISLTVHVFLGDWDVKIQLTSVRREMAEGERIELSSWV